MMKSLFPLSAFLLAAALTSACATSSEEYAGQDCDRLRALAGGQDYAASVRGIRLENDRGVEEVRGAAGSHLLGQRLTNNEKSLRDERQDVRDAYRRKGCNA